MFQEQFGGAANRLINQIEAGTLGPASSGLDTRNQIVKILGESPEADTASFDPLNIFSPKIKIQALL